MKSFIPRRRAFVVPTVAMLIIFISGCVADYEAPLRFGSNVWPGYEPVYLARSLGYLDKKKIKLVEYLSATQAMRGLTNGSIESAGLTLDEALLLRQQGVDVKIVLAMDFSAGADALVVRSGIDNLVDLKGKHVAAETTALGAYMIHRVLDLAGLELKDIHLVRRGVSHHERVFANGEVDAVITFDPIRTRLLKQGGKVLLDTRDLAGEVVDVMVVRTDAFDKHKENINSLIKAWYKTLDYIEKNKEKAVGKMSVRMNVSAEDVSDSLDAVEFPNEIENRLLLLDMKHGLLEQAKSLSKVMYDNDLITSPVNAQGLFDENLLLELYP